MQCQFCGIHHQPCDREFCYCGIDKPNPKGEGFNEKCEQFWSQTRPFGVVGDQDVGAIRTALNFVDHALSDVGEAKALLGANGTQAARQYVGLALPQAVTALNDMKTTIENFLKEAK